MTDGMVDRSNASAASDQGCTPLHLGSTEQGECMNVLIDLGEHPGRGVHSSSTSTRGQILLDEALPLAQSIYDRVLKARAGISIIISPPVHAGGLQSV
jgi:hypothetical protein